MAPKKIDAGLQDILNELAKDSKPGNVLYLKPGDTTVKLLMPKGRTDIRQFYQRFLSTFKGEQFPYFLICGVVTEADEDGVADAERIRYIKVSKTVLLEIVNLLTKKWDLFAEQGPVIVITQGKKAGKPVYSVAAVPDTFSAAGLNHPDQSIEDAAADQEQRSVEMDAEKNSGEQLK